MNCPYCGSPMAAGKILGSDRILCVSWLPAKLKPRWLTRNKVIDSGGLIMADKPFPAFPTKEAFLCRQCKIGVFSFANNLLDET